MEIKENYEDEIEIQEQVLDYSIAFPADAKGSLLSVADHLLGRMFPLKENEEVQIVDIGATRYSPDGGDGEKILIQITTGTEPNNKPVLAESIDEPSTAKRHPLFTYPDGSRSGYPSTLASYDKPHKLQPFISIKGKNVVDWDVELDFFEIPKKGESVKLIVKYRFCKEIK